MRLKTGPKKRGGLTAGRGRGGGGREGGRIENVCVKVYVVRVNGGKEEERDVPRILCARIG